VELDIRTLSPSNLEDYLAFFESIPFTEHPDWNRCYCYSFHFTGPDEEWDKDRNREAVRKLVLRGGMTGLLAYHQGRPVGWCNVNRRRNFQRLASHYPIKDPEDPGFASIVCFLVHPDYRRKGITRSLLLTAIDNARKEGFCCMEAYPARSTSSIEKNYHGYLSLYQETGFDLINTLDHCYVVRKDLTID
jgi:GNAT superfamily N-acetyltransferase